MKKIAGILGLFIVILVFTTLQSSHFVTAYNIENLIRWSALFGLISIGVSFVIVTGGIDLSIGSVIALTGVLLPMFLWDAGMPPVLAMPLVVGICALIGLKHGLLITKARIQPFVVTLSSLMLYRGLARVISNDEYQGLQDSFQEFKYLAVGRPFSIPIPFLPWISEGGWSPYRWDDAVGERVLDAAGQPVALPLFEWVGVPMPALMLVAVAVAAIGFLHFSVPGRYLLALGRNEQAARLSGIDTHGLVILAYVISSGMAGFAGVLFLLNLNAVQPNSHGNFYELYAIAAAVLGGCSLRGGEVSIVGVIIGAAVMRALYNAINMIDWIPKQTEFVVIGLVILAGAIVDESVRRLVARRRARREAAAHESGPERLTAAPAREKVAT